MIVTSLDVTGYRNLSPIRFFPSPLVNVIYGDNAQGKSNLLEAIWIFTGGRSFRGAKDAELIAFGQEKANVTLSFFAGGRDQQAEITFENGKRRGLVNGIVQRSPAAMVGKFCAVIFSPDHLSFVKEGPQERRKFLDAAICQIKPAFATALNRYNKSILQRNALLKDIYRKPYLIDTLDSWDEAAASLGAILIRERLRYLDLLRPKAEELYRGISSQKESLNLAYHTAYPLSEAEMEKSLLIALKQHREIDLKTGTTGVGPHRDDLVIQINGVPARNFGSQGQQRSAVLALKLSEASVLCNAIGEKPVVLLDDVMSELDLNRQDYLLNHMRDFQVFITCCDPAAVLRLMNGKSFQMNGGVLSPDQN